MPSRPSRPARTAVSTNAYPGIRYRRRRRILIVELIPFARKPTGDPTVHLVHEEETQPLLNLLTAVAKSSEIVAVLLDCRQLRHINTSGLGVLISVHSQLTKHNKDFWLFGVPGEVEPIFLVTKANRMLNFAPDLQSAYRHLRTTR